MIDDGLALTDLDGKPPKRQKGFFGIGDASFDLQNCVRQLKLSATRIRRTELLSQWRVWRLTSRFYPEVYFDLGCVPLTGYGTPSTIELTESMKPFVEHHNALLMANHGAVAYGEDLWQAFDRLETLEHTARIAILAKALGGANDLPKGAIEKLINIREKAGYLTEAARCQSCGYLEETGIGCGHDAASDSKFQVPNSNGNGAKISQPRRVDRAFESGEQIELNLLDFAIQINFRSKKSNAGSIRNGRM
jgi:hypothetical protein